MKRLFLLFALLAALPAFAQNQTASTSNPVGGNLTASTTNCTVAQACVWQKLPITATTTTVTITGTFSATLIIETSADNGNTFTQQSSQTAAAVVTFTTTSLTDVRVRCSAFTSGNVGVFIQTAGNQQNVTITTTTGGGGGLGSPALPLTANLVSEPLFLDGSGTVMTDSSGAGNTCTLGAAGAAPTVNSVASGGGLTFLGTSNQFCAFPAAMNTAKSFLAAVSFQMGVTPGPANNSFLNEQFLSGSGAVATSLNWQLYDLYSTDTWSPGGQGAAQFRTQGTTTAAWNASSSCNFLGTGVIGLTLAASDTFYINGQPCLNRQTGSSLNQQSTGVLQLGGSSTLANPNNQQFTGTVYCFAAWNVVLTAPQVAQASQALSSSCLTQRGITPFLGGSISNPINIVPALQDSHDSLVLEGDSLFAGINIPAQGINGAALSTSDTAINGTGTWGVLSRFALNDATLYRPAANRNTLIEWAGTNDSAQAPISVVANLNATARIAEQMGFKTVFATMISRGANEPFRDKLNPLIRQYVPLYSSYNGILDLGANTHLGCDGCNANGTYFNGDLVHLTQFTATNIIGPYYVFAFNRANGNKVGSASYNIYTGTGVTIPTLLQSVDCPSLSGLSVTCTLPWNTTAGSLITVTTNCVSCASSAINVPTDSQALSYTAITAGNGYTGSALMRAFYAPNSTAAASTVTQTFTGGAPSNEFITVQEWGGVLTAAPLDVASAIATGTSASPLTAGITTTVVGDLLFGYGATFIASATAAYSPYGTYWQPIAPLILANNMLPVAASGTVTGATGSYTTSSVLQLSTSAWGAGAAAFKPVAGTSTFQLQAADIYAECAPNSTNNVALILPDGTTLTGGTVTIKNNQTAGAATCVVNAPTPYATGVQQTIDGATSVTIANKATAVFKSKYSFTGTAGTNLVPVITWELLQNN